MTAPKPAIASPTPSITTISIARSREVVEGESYHLLEALAKRTADTILDRFSVRRVRVRISKQNLGWTTGGRAVIEVTRERTP
jgi:dihydroneopterin aldolase